MMTEEQRYLFDLCGFLHLKNVLTPEELDAASEAARHYIDSASEERLAPETLELLETAHYTHKKEIATRQRVCLSQ